MLSRRFFLANICVPHIHKKNINFTNVNDKSYVYQSNNNKFIYEQYFDDEDQSVTVYTKKRWYDPITKKERTNLLKELFILDENEV